MAACSSGSRLTESHDADSKFPADVTDRPNPARTSSNACSCGICNRSTVDTLPGLRVATSTTHVDSSADTAFFSRRTARMTETVS